MRISLHPHAIHDVTCLSVRMLSLRVCLSPVSLPLLPFLFHNLNVLCPAHQFPQCRHRRRLKTLHSRTMRSLAPWRFSILSDGLWLSPPPKTVVVLHMRYIDKVVKVPAVLSTGRASPLTLPPTRVSKQHCRMEIFSNCQVYRRRRGVPIASCCGSGVMFNTALSPLGDGRLLWTELYLLLASFGDTQWQGVVLRFSVLARGYPSVCAPLERFGACEDALATACLSESADRAKKTFK